LVILDIVKFKIPIIMVQIVLDQPKM
jgi:hypothetical protein